MTSSESIIDLSSFFSSTYFSSDNTKSSFVLWWKITKMPKGRLLLRYKCLKIANFKTAFPETCRQLIKACRDFKKISTVPDYLNSFLSVMCLRIVCDASFACGRITSEVCVRVLPSSSCWFARRESEKGTRERCEKGVVCAEEGKRRFTRTPSLLDQFAGNVITDLSVAGDSFSSLRCYVFTHTFQHSFPSPQSEDRGQRS